LQIGEYVPSELKVLLHFVQIETDKEKLIFGTSILWTEQHIKVIVENNSYTVNVEESSESGFVGNCLELPTAISQGESILELEKNIRGNNASFTRTYGQMIHNP